MPHEIAKSDEVLMILLPPDAGKDQRHRLKRFAEWTNRTGKGWALPDLRQYRDYLLEDGLSPESVAVHLSTVRSRYRELLLNRKLLYSLIPRQDSFAEHKALVDELVARIEAAIDPRSAPVKSRTSQDRPDSEHLRLSQHQARELLHSPDTSKLAGLRDRAIIAILLCTGIREAELCALQVEDLEQRLEGQLSLHVRSGKGMKQRMVPYGAMTWCLAMTRQWLYASRIRERFVFRGLRKGDNIRDTPLNERTVQKLLARYPIDIDGKLVIVRPHDCRRSYARWLYESGVKVDAIRQNLGHETIQMTFHYIGNPDISDRLPPDKVFQPW
jgi:site-specific recombinase XerD